MNDKKSDKSMTFLMKDNLRLRTENAELKKENEILLIGIKQRNRKPTNMQKDGFGNGNHSTNGANIEDYIIE